MSDLARIVPNLARTDAGTPASRGGTPTRWLADRPQRLGILPTWWFWNERRNWRLIMGLVIPTMLTVTAVVDLLGGGLLGLALTPALVVTAMLGLVERHIRRRLVAPDDGQTTSKC